MAAIKFILRFAADNLATTKILFIYYKLKYNFVVKIPNSKSGKTQRILCKSLPS